jgi:PAS domain S-box-containing protein
MIVNGKEFWINTSLNPVKDEMGNVTAVVGITRDITERKRAENALKESEEKFRAIFENAGEGIIVADAKTKKFTFANPAIYRILGYKEKELLKLKVNDIHPKKDLPRVMEQFKKQLQKKILSANLPVLRKDKKVIFCNITATPLIINGKECIVGFFLKK